MIGAAVFTHKLISTGAMPAGMLHLKAWYLNTHTIQVLQTSIAGHTSSFMSWPRLSADNLLLKKDEYGLLGITFSNMNKMLGCIGIAIIE